MMYIMNRLEDAQQATTDERVRKVTEATSLQSRVSLSPHMLPGVASAWCSVIRSSVWCLRTFLLVKQQA